MLRRCFLIRQAGASARSNTWGNEHVRKVFDTVAPQYDFMNDVLSLGVHRLWKQHFVESCVAPKPGLRYLDVAGGTGDIAFRIIDSLRSSQRGFTQPAAQARHSSHALADVVVLDINAKMLEEGQARARRNGYANSGVLTWVEGSAEQLPFADATFDSYTVAFGIRNFGDRPKALREAHRVLRVGGVLNVLEFSKITCPLMSVPYELHSSVFIPLAARVLSDEASYQYLVDSIRAFPDQQTFAGLISEAGFGFVRHQDLTGGIAAVHTAVKVDAALPAAAATGGDNAAAVAPQ